MDKIVPSFCKNTDLSSDTHEGSLFHTIYRLCFFSNTQIKFLLEKFCEIA